MFFDKLLSKNRIKNIIVCKKKKQLKNSIYISDDIFLFLRLDTRIQEKSKN